MRIRGFRIYCKCIFAWRRFPSAIELLCCDCRHLKAIDTSGSCLVDVHFESTNDQPEAGVLNCDEKSDVIQQIHGNSEDVEIFEKLVHDVFCDTPPISIAGDNFSVQIDEKLHEYSSITTIEFCYRFIGLFRDSNVCKSKTDDYLNLIRSILPHPNNLPSSMSKIMYLLKLEDNFFQKRIICLVCKTENMTVSNCCDCCSSVLNDDNSVSVFDSDIFMLLESLLQSQYSTVMKFISGAPE